jgi:predicted nucleic acid-binding protein
LKQIYLDVCALCRPYDDQSYSRIHLETVAVRLILKKVEARRYRMITSPVHKFEISDIANYSERIDLLLLLEKLGERVEIDNHAARARAETLTRFGMGPADAAHLAFAEAAKADFLSCDDKLIKKCSRMTVDVWTGNPVAFCDKENLR